MLKKKKNIKNNSNALPENRKNITNKNGLDIFENDTDIFDLFLKKDADIRDFELKKLDEQTEKDQNISSYKNQAMDSKERAFLKNRNGILFLDHSQSLSKMFIKETGKNNPDNRHKNISIVSIQNNNENHDNRHKYDEHERSDFYELIEQTLKGKSKNDIMREKSDKPLPEPVPLKKRLKRYPAAQDELDLHGYTAKDAERKTDSYLRTSWRNGLFTVQIIVGKGIHSPNGAVLPNLVEDIILRLKREGIVLWFEWDKRTKNQSGAVIIYLRQLN